MNLEPYRRAYNAESAYCPSTPGARVVLLRTADAHAGIAPLDEGTVESVDDAGTVHVLWNNGSRLGLIPNVDLWRKSDDTTGHLDSEPTLDTPSLCARCGAPLVPGCCDTTEGADR
ncbi:hypothetical protein J3D45_002940 [Microbacterium foliorum]|uniref:DUF4314 domain-containing protein n=1 Tax=Microbacterium foliorum TaxID=104336 RepID=UPI00209C8D2E|nr:DUF4314 domain-containing protein [Microbacterium foliorum]MCP1430442.1 hypothetical protein [Microbacterium foliorum]